MTVIEVTARPVLLLGWDPEREAAPASVSGGVSVGTFRVDASVSPVSVVGSLTVGTVDVSENLTLLLPDSIAGATTTGDPSVAYTVLVTGIAPSGATGQPKTVVAVALSGVAGATSAGTPSVILVASPSTVSSSLALGLVSVDNSAAVFPVSVREFTSMGMPQMINRRFVLRTPRNTYQWRLFKEYEGISLLKENGVWSEVAHPDLERTKAAEIYLGGGRDHVLSDELRAELAALGYPSIEEIV